jgi:hypothetical protein
MRVSRTTPRLATESQDEILFKGQLHLEVRIRSSPCFSGASSIDRGCVELCARQTSPDLVGFHVCWYGFSPVSSHLRLSSLAMVVIRLKRIYNF